jgi:hypothetical protein
MNPILPLLRNQFFGSTEFFSGSSSPFATYFCQKSTRRERKKMTNSQKFIPVFYNFSEDVSRIHHPDMLSQAAIRGRTAGSKKRGRRFLVFLSSEKEVI